MDTKSQRGNASETLQRFLALFFIVAGIALVVSLWRELSSNDVRPGARVLTSQPASIANSPALAEGAMLYQTYCYVCHGVTGEGNGAAAFVLDPRPRNFRIG